MESLEARSSLTPDEAAIVDGFRRLTWQDATDLVFRAARALRAVAPEPGQRVAVFAENAVEALVAYAAALRAGVSVIPVSFHLGVEELEFILRDGGAVAVWTGPENVDVALAAAAAGGLDVTVWRSDRAGATRWEDLLAANSAEPMSLDLPAAPNLLYTSGTTGFPKGVLRPPNPPDTVGGYLGQLATQHLHGYGTHLVSGPLYHNGPQRAVELFVLGHPVVLVGRFDAGRVLAAIEDWRVESTIMVPTHFVRLLALADDIRSGYDVSSLRRVAHTGSSCAVDVKRAMIEWWGPVLYEAYGATEVGTTASITSEEWLAHPGSVGRAIDPFAAVVVDDEGRVVPAGTIGRLYFRDRTGRGVEYHQNPAASDASHLEPGVFTLGEIGYVDDDGYIYICDRFADMVVSGGVNIYPAECERVLLEHPAVADAALVGVHDDVMGERLIGLVVLRGAATATELTDYCRSRLASYKVPREVEFVDSLPRNAMGKLNKRVLRDELLVDRAR
jgi:long-chain acyl-CoA synthetase